MQKKKKFELPHVYTIAFLLIILFAVLTWIVPSGQFERTEMETAAGTREVDVAIRDGLIGPNAADVLR